MTGTERRFRFTGSGTYYALRDRFGHLPVVVVFNVFAWLMLVAGAAIHGTLRMEPGEWGLLDIERFPLYVILPGIWILLMVLLPRLIAAYYTALESLGGDALPGGVEAVDQLHARLNGETPGGRRAMRTIFGVLCAGLIGILLVVPLASPGSMGRFWCLPEYPAALVAVFIYHVGIGAQMTTRVLWTIWAGHRAMFKRLNAAAESPEVKCNPLAEEGLPGVGALSPVILLTYFIAFTPFIVVIGRVMTSGKMTPGMVAACVVLGLGVPVLLIWPIMSVHRILKRRRDTELARFNAAVERDYLLLREFYGRDAHDEDVPAEVKRAAERLPQTRELVQVVRGMNTWPWNMLSTVKALLPLVVSVLAVLARFIGQAVMKK